MSKKYTPWLAAAGLLAVTAFGASVAAQQGRSRPAGANAATVAKAPPVLLTNGHAQLCKVKTGEAFPAIELPQAGGGLAKLEQLAGKKATVVLVWSPEGWMSRAAQRDFALDLAPEAAARGVSVVGIVVGAGDAVGAEIQKAGAKFPQLHDADGQATAQLGSGSLPRVYVLDPQRKIAWFDIEYSEATRRELEQTLAALGATR